MSTKRENISERKFSTPFIFGVLSAGLTMASVLMPAIKAPVHEFFTSMSASWTELLIAVGKISVDPVISYFIYFLNKFGVKLSLVSYYREIFVVLAFYCANSIRASFERSRYLNILLSVFLFVLLGTLSSLDVADFLGTKNRFIFALFAFCVYDTAQAAFDARFHTISGKSRTQTFIWYFNVQIFWSFLFAVFFVIVSHYWHRQSYDGSDLITYIMMIFSLGLRNVFVGFFHVLKKRTKDQSFRDCFLTSYTARVGVALILTVWFAMGIVATGVGAHFIAKYL